MSLLPYIGGSRTISPLKAAADNGHLEIVKMLIEKGADVNYRNEDLTTALEEAHNGRHEEVVDLLLENGAEWDDETDESDYD